MRGSTENVYHIIGNARTSGVAYREMNKHKQQVGKLESRMIEKLRELFRV